MIDITPQRIGARRAQDAIAWRVGAAAAGGSAISALIGLLISATSLSLVGPALTGLAVILLGANVVFRRLARGPRKKPAPSRRARSTPVRMRWRTASE
jgi:uncharacterized membrane protein YfcA